MKYLMSLALCTFASLALAQSETAPTQETAKPTQQMGGSSNKLSDAALKYECKNGNNLRRLEIKFDDAATKVPCKVEYTKETENPGVTQTLWNANADFNYCEEKASGFVTKLEGMGWTCTGQ